MSQMKTLARSLKKLKESKLLLKTNSTIGTFYRTRRANTTTTLKASDWHARGEV